MYDRNLDCSILLANTVTYTKTTFQREHLVINSKKVSTPIPILKLFLIPKPGFSHTLALHNFGTILFMYKLCVTEKRTIHNKIEIPHFLTVWCSVPTNKLPRCRSSETPKNPIFDRRHEKVLHPNFRYNQKNIRMYRMNRPEVMFKPYITKLN